MFCKNCGNQIEDNVTVCPNCNSVIENTDTNKESSNKSNKSYRKIVTFIICLFLGYWGIHRFCMGYKKSGFCMFFLAIFSVVFPILLVILAGLLAKNMVNITVPSNALVYVFMGIAMVPTVSLGIWNLCDLVRILIGKLVPKESSIICRMFPG